MFEIRPVTAGSPKSLRGATRPLGPVGAGAGIGSGGATATAGGTAARSVVVAAVPGATAVRVALLPVTPRRFGMTVNCV